MKNRHSFQVRKRALVIWQKLGYFPWRKPKEARQKKSGDFYKGAFDSIPFLNEDAKRTFLHLLLRPGYMIRDYIKGDHEKYLAPLTSLIIFYAFFALVSAVLQPVQQKKAVPFQVNVSDEYVEENQEIAYRLLIKPLTVARKGYILLHLDQFPDEVDSQHESSLAALEATLRSQGIPLFLGQFLLLWLSMGIALRKRRIGMSACAAASAYVLCQFSFFMLFAVLSTLGKNTSISVGLMFLLLVLDYHEWLGTDLKGSAKLALSTGVLYGLLLAAAYLLVSGIVLLLAFGRG
jgi:hypothetical protein